MIELLSSFSQTTGIYAFMHTPWGWPIIESLHFIGLCLLFGTVGLFDLRMIGLGKGVQYSVLHRLIPFGVLGFLLNVVTGTMFVTSAPDQYLFNPAFQTKLFAMMLAGINMLVFYKTCSSKVINTAAMASVLPRAKLIGVISLLSWSIVIVCGRLITYYRPPYHWCWFC